MVDKFDTLFVEPRTPEILTADGFLPPPPKTRTTQYNGHCLRPLARRDTVPAYHDPTTSGAASFLLRHRLPIWAERTDPIGSCLLFLFTHLPCQNRERLFRLWIYLFRGTLTRLRDGRLTRSYSAISTELSTTPGSVNRARPPGSTRLPKKPT